MLPNHAPYVVAEQFGTLATIHPGRIDLGLGRAPGTDPFTTRALRRNEAAAMNFAGEVEELIGYLGDPDPDAKVRAIPGEGTHVPIWILGSSHGGAQVAAALGLPYSFASHFAPGSAHERARGLPVAIPPRRPSPAALTPRARWPASTSWSPTRPPRRERLFTSVLQRFHGIVTGAAPACPSRRATSRASWRTWSPAERQAVSEMTRVSLVGTPDEVRDGLAGFVEATGVDEVIVTCGAHDHEDRLRSYELLADAWS